MSLSSADRNHGMSVGTLSYFFADGIGKTWTLELKSMTFSVVASLIRATLMLIN